MNNITYDDNCCEITDDWTLNWRIDFVEMTDPINGAKYTPASINRTGQPSEYIDDILLWETAFISLPPTPYITDNRLQRERQR